MREDMCHTDSEELHKAMPLMLWGGRGRTRVCLTHGRGLLDCFQSSQHTVCWVDQVTVVSLQAQSGCYHQHQERRGE